jgi:hypothetical protein
MAIVAGFDVHRRQITFDALDTETGEVMRGRIDATPAAVAVWARRFAGREVDVAVEACTGGCSSATRWSGPGLWRTWPNRSWFTHRLTALSAAATIGISATCHRSRTRTLSWSSATASAAAGAAPTPGEVAKLVSASHRPILRASQVRDIFTLARRMGTSVKMIDTATWWPARTLTCGSCSTPSTSDQSRAGRAVDTLGAEAAAWRSGPERRKHRAGGSSRCSGFEPRRSVATRCPAHAVA